MTYNIIHKMPKTSRTNYRMYFKYLLYIIISEQIGYSYTQRYFSVSETK